MLVYEAYLELLVQVLLFYRIPVVANFLQSSSI